MAKKGDKSKKGDERQPALFDLGEAIRPEPALKRPRYPVWTENKAKLIQRYLKLFIHITKHGAYIDAFAGPQEPDKVEMWAARLVLETRPRWLRNFFLFELVPDKVTMLEQLVKAQPARAKNEPKRTVQVFPGDMNTELCKVLNESPIGQKEAAFCLLDQRTFECHWQTVEKIAQYKRAPENKIELFYFMPNSWLDRAFSGLKDEAKALLWWGRDDWQSVRKARGQARAQLFVERFKALGYASVKPWPIYEREGGGRTMYFMIHATDHPEAPTLMSRAYAKAVLSDQEFEQLVLSMPLEASTSTPAKS
ncbi:MAG TPA: three-Cys-motif partner protein TcmP [Candidatus Krumholzibacteria bacterium]